MPMILEARVKKLIGRGLPKSEAYGIATKQLQKSGVLRKGSRKLSGSGSTSGSASSSSSAGSSRSSAPASKSG